jgi:hypothetical protein
MPDTRSHRGPHPSDRELFAEAHYAKLQAAVADFAWLLGRGYADTSALKLVGDRFALTARQRMAVARATCSDRPRLDRKRRETGVGDLAGRSLLVDGFNVLTTLEVALSGGVVLQCRDDCLRDIAGMHGHYRILEETMPAIGLLSETLRELRPASVTWHLDQPVSNSGRLAHRLREIFSGQPYHVEVRLVADPDALLVAEAQGDTLAATADSLILDRCGPWFNLAQVAVARHVPKAWIVPMVNP